MLHLQHFLKGGALCVFLCALASMPGAYTVFMIT